jgi:hypothetical protein
VRAGAGRRGHAPQANTRSRRCWERECRDRKCNEQELPHWLPPGLYECHHLNLPDTTAAHNPRYRLLYRAAA